MKMLEGFLQGEKYRIFTDAEGITLYREEASGIDQEQHFLITHETNTWNTYLVQRGKPFLRYQTTSPEIAQFSAYLLYMKYELLHPAPFQWDEIDKLIRAGRMAEAIQQSEQDLGMQPSPIALQADSTGYRVVFQGEEQVAELLTCSDARNALRAYRYHRLLCDDLSRACDTFFAEYPQWLDERNWLLLMALR